MAAGFDPLVCTNGADALQAIAAQNSDLVVLDLGLPEVDGWAILGRLRAKPRTSSVPVLIVTRRGDAADSEAGRSEWLPLQTLRRRQVSQPGQRARRSRVGKATDGPVRTRVTDHERDPLSIFRCRRLRQRRACRFAATLSAAPPSAAPRLSLRCHPLRCAAFGSAAPPASRRGKTASGRGMHPTKNEEPGTAYAALIRSGRTTWKQAPPRRSDWR
jgi:CheY-like chemotaxis protein